MVEKAGLTNVGLTVVLFHGYSYILLFFSTTMENHLREDQKQKREEGGKNLQAPHKAAKAKTIDII